MHARVAADGHDPVRQRAARHPHQGVAGGAPRRPARPAGRLLASARRTRRRALAGLSIALPALVGAAAGATVPLIGPWAAPVGWRWRPCRLPAGPWAGWLADRYGERRVVLAFSLANAAAIAALVAGALAGVSVALPALLGAAGATVPLIGPLWPPARWSPSRAPSTRSPSSRARPWSAWSPYPRQRLRTAPDGEGDTARRPSGPQRHALPPRMPRSVHPRA
ncbi:hypothetical protein [Streptomyces sp. NPDC001137]|uniref:hypothetical protein n=1 Tax=Streptomyces sp. NPDC001137 TaxID=3154378 RepID=UPI00332DF79A